MTQATLKGASRDITVIERDFVHEKHKVTLLVVVESLKIYCVPSMLWIA